MTCKHGHELRTDRDVYTDRHGHKRCRTCQLSYHAQRRGAYRGTYRAQLQPHRYTKWAEQTWAQMTSWERIVVAHGLQATEELWT